MRILQSSRLVMPEWGRLVLLSLMLVLALPISVVQGADANQQTRIILGAFQTSITQTPIYVARDTGLFKAANLDVEILSLTGGIPSAMAAVVNGSVGVVMAGPSEFIEYSARKVISARAIAEYADSIYELVAIKGINSVQQLKGKVIGISGPNGGDHLWLKAVLQHHGISEKDVTFLTTGNPANRLTALSAGVVQAIAGSSYSRDTSQRIGSILVKAADSPVQVPTGMIIATNQYIGAHKPALRKFVKAMGDASQWIRKNPQQAVAICVKCSGATREACAGGIKILADPVSSGHYTWSPTFAVNSTGLAAALEQVRTTNPEARALKLESLVDSTIAEPLR